MATIHGAAATGNVEAIKRFLDDGVPIDKLSMESGDFPGGKTALYVAVVMGQLEAAKFLLERGADCPSPKFTLLTA